MSLSGFSLKHPVMIFMISIAIIIFGVIGSSRLSLSLMPPTVKPGLTVITEYSGIAPLKIENMITMPIEDAVSTVEGIENIISSSEEGKSRINIEFKIGTDMDMAALKVREKIYLIRSNFPRTVQEPLVIRYDPSNKPIVILSLSGGNITEMRTYAENVLKRKFESVKGVSEVQISGGLQKEIWVVVNRDNMYAQRFQVDDIISEVNGSNFNLPGGKISILGMDISVQTRGRYRSLHEIRQTRLKRRAYNGNENVNTNSILDVARVINHYRDRDSIYRENDQEKVSIYIQKAGNANTIKIAEEILNQIKGISQFKIEVSYNQAKYIKKSLSRVKDAGLIGGLIAMLILLIFLKELKNTIAIAVSIPLSILLTFFLMYISGLGLDIMSMSGLALGIGMLVDNSIVVLENIHKYNAKTAVEIERAVNEVFLSIVASTLTTIAVFLPIIFTSIEVKNLYGGFALSVGYSIFSSLLLSVTLIPVLYYKLHGKRETNLYATISKKVRRVILLDKILNIVTYLRIRKYYVKLLFVVLRRKKKTLLITAVLLIISILVFPLLKKEYMDPFDTGEIICMVELPSGTNLFATDRIVKKVEKILRGKKYIEQVSTKVEKWHATLYIKFVPPEKRNMEQDEIMVDLKKTFNTYNEAFVHFSENTSDIGTKEIDIQIVGDDLKKIKQFAKQFSQKIKGIEGIRDVVLNFKTGRPEYLIVIDKDKASLSGLTVSQIAQNIRNGIFGPVATKYLERGREIDLRVRFMKRFRSDPADLRHILIRNPDGDMVRLEEIAKFVQQKSETKIFRKNQKRFVSITVKLGRIDLGNAVEKISKVLGNIPLPQDYRYEFGDSFEKMIKNQREMLMSVILSFLLIYMILASQFESFKYPFLIVFSIPFAFIGIIILFYLLRKSFNISVYIGMIMLAGIVVNNAIVLVDSFNQRREKNHNLLLTVITVSRERLKPIMMTTLTTVLGLLPLLVETGEGSNLWKPMGLTVISGLIFSTFLTLLIIPLAYILISGKNKKNPLKK